MSTDDRYQFNLSLNTLNLLGRGLYQNFATPIAEAVSNAWDANAKNVHIDIDEDGDTLTIRDDGHGMSSDDFKDRFLEIGFPRRDHITNKRRKVHGRKGIGKLALLSVSDSIEIRTRKRGAKTTVGGIINNHDLDQAIEDRNPYPLGLLGKEAKQDQSIANGGTKLIFRQLKPRFNTAEYIRLYLARAFNFPITSDNDTFNIYVGEGNPVSIEEFRVVLDKTEAVWFFDKEADRSRWATHFPTNKALKRFSIQQNYFKSGDRKHLISGYIASVEKPRHLKVLDGDFTMTISLYTNGRMRKTNIFDGIGSARFVPKYLYGEIHVDSFDDGTNECEDLFPTDREGLMEQSDEYHNFIEYLRGVQQKIFDEWDALRRKKEQTS